jgi:hypothetical protein
MNDFERLLAYTLLYGNESILALNRFLNPSFECRPEFECFRWLKFRYDAESSAEALLRTAPVHERERVEQALASLMEERALAKKALETGAIDPDWVVASVFPDMVEEAALEKESFLEAWEDENGLIFGFYVDLLHLCGTATSFRALAGVDLFRLLFVYKAARKLGLESHVMHNNPLFKQERDNVEEIATLCGRDVPQEYQDLREKLNLTYEPIRQKDLPWRA